MINQEISEIFNDIADVLEIKGVQWKPRAYRKASIAIANLSEDVEEIYQKKGVQGLEEIPGVGKGLAEKIIEYIKTRRIKEYENLLKKFPKEFLELLRIPGIGVKTITTLHEKLGIKNIKDLEKAAKQGKISKLLGFKRKTEQNILEGISFVKKIKYGKKGKELLLNQVLKISREISNELKNLKEVKRVDIAGSIRRMKETVHDIDMLIITSNPKKTMDYFSRLKNIKKVLAKGLKKTSVLTNENIQIDLRAFEEKNYGAALQYFTGSKQHSIHLRKIANQKNLKINEYGIFDKNGKRIGGEQEEEIYKKLGLQFIPPELREDNGEIESAKKKNLPKLVSYKIKGDLHVHTKWSDGNETIEDMAKQAEKLGYKYLVISDHCGKMKIAHALDSKRLLQQIKEIEKIDKKFKVKLLKGAEVDILKDGTLSIPKEILKKLDVVIASVHSGFKMSEQEMTNRVLKAMDHPYVNIIGHPTGRIINQRNPYRINLEKIFKKAAKNKIALEINSFPDRLDLNDSNIRRAIKFGAKLAIGTDSHSKENLEFIELGIGQARRGWAQSKDILNTFSLNELMKFFKKNKAL